LRTTATEFSFYMVFFIGLIGFIAPYTFAQIGTIAILHTFQFTVAYALGFSVIASRILATDLSQSHCNFVTHEVFLAQSNSFLAISAAANSEDSTQFFSTTLDYCCILRPVF
jgi:hypothetical protein